MASDIRFSDSEAEFSFRNQDGTLFLVRTEVGDDDFAHVVVSEQCEQTTMEPEGDE